MALSSDITPKELLYRSKQGCRTCSKIHHVITVQFLNLTGIFLNTLIKLPVPFLLAFILVSCGGSGKPAVSIPVVAQAKVCAVPRPAATLDPQTNLPYGDVQGTLSDEIAWIGSFVRLTYLWYQDLPSVGTSSYFIGASVPYVDPATNTASTKYLSSNYMVVDAYFNSQRSALLTASGKPKDRFHFTALTADYQAQSAQGTQAGFGFEIALLSATPPRQALAAYVTPGSPADLNGIKRGTRFLSINGVDVTNGTDLTTLNNGLYTPVAGTAYTFVVQIPDVTGTSTMTMTPVTVNLTPVMHVQTLPAPDSRVGYILYTDQIATAESELIAAINQLKSGAGITDLVLDLRYNGGGYLDLASELAYMIAGSAKTAGKFFEQDSFNNKNPFGTTSAQATVPFHSTTQGFSIPSGQTLPQLNLSTVYVITGPGTCSASEAIMNGLIGIGVKVVQIGATTCGKPYGFYPQDNCSTTYFAIQFSGANYLGFSDYADGFVPGGTGSTANNLPGCAATDDFNNELGNPAEASLATALYYMHNNGACPGPASAMSGPAVFNRYAEPLLKRPPFRENRILGQLTPR